MKVVLRLCSYYSFRHNVQLKKVSRNIDDLDKIVIVYVTTYSDLAYFILLMLDREKSIGNVPSSVAASAVMTKVEERLCVMSHLAYLKILFLVRSWLCEKQFIVHNY
jgi:hypothetical protein